MKLEGTELGLGQSRFRYYAKNITVVMSIAVLALMQACGGGGSSPEPNVGTTPPAQEKGDFVVSITDAPGDFVMYAIDIEKLTLYRANGDVVETLPFSTRVDFSELTEVTEFLTIASVPAGNYESVSLTLDYTNADIIVQDDTGAELKATAVDENGDPLGVLDVRLELTTTDVIRIAPGRPAAFSLDFDLDASNEIDFSGAEPTVMVDAFLLATPELETDREHRVRGVLADVNEAEEKITLKVRPFRHRNGDFGRFTLSVDENTQYEVDGTGYTGGAGLTAMAALAENTPVVANGMISGMGMMAHTVIAGSSVPWTDSDVVKGVVIARELDTLTVRGARIEFKDGTEIYRGEGTVILGPGTTVTAPGVDNSQLTIQSISVGQRIIAFGELVDDKTLDASNSRVIMRMNQLTAEVVDAQPLAVDLFFLNGRRPGIFNFAGTGVDQSMDANPTYYQIDTGALSLNTIQDGDLVRVRGLVNDFGAAPDDFNARTVIDVSLDSRAAALKVLWAEGTQMPFNNVSESEVDVNLTESREILRVRGVPVNFFRPLDNIFLAAPGDDVKSVYAVKVRGGGEIHIYRDFADLTVELQKQLDEGASLHHIAAHGRYNANTNELTSVRASFGFKAASE